MALITCPECGNQISSESEVCIHCGYPIKQVTTTQTELDDYVVIMSGYSGTSKAKAISALVDVCGYTTSEAREIVNDLPQEVVRGATRELSVSVAQALDAEGVDASIYQGNTQVTYTSRRSSNSSGLWRTLGLIGLINATYRRPRRWYVPVYTPRPRFGIFGMPTRQSFFGGPVNRAVPRGFGGGISRGGIGGAPNWGGGPRGGLNGPRGSNGGPRGRGGR